jgi:hypothetical protein
MLLCKYAVLWTSRGQIFDLRADANRYTRQLGSRDQGGGETAMHQLGRFGQKAEYLFKSGS